MFWPTQQAFQQLAWDPQKSGHGLCGISNDKKKLLNKIGGDMFYDDGINLVINYFHLYKLPLMFVYHKVIQMTDTMLGEGVKQKKITTFMKFTFL